MKLIRKFKSFTGSSYAHFLFTMTLVGLAWNFILIRTTHLLPKTYHEHERAKVQGATDFLIFGFGSFGSLIAGFAFYFMGWDFVNIMGLAIGVGIIIAMGLLRNSLNEKSFS